MSFFICSITKIISENSGYMVNACNHSIARLRQVIKNSRHLRIRIVRLCSNNNNNNKNNKTPNK